MESQGKKNTTQGVQQELLKAKFVLINIQLTGTVGALLLFLARYGPSPAPLWVLGLWVNRREPTYLPSTSDARGRAEMNK